MCAHSQSADEADICSDAEINLKELIPYNKKIDLSSIHKILTKHVSTSWASYVFGCVIMLIHDHHIHCNGVNIWINSNVPIGKGVSSSAALEVAVLSALCAAYKNCKIIHYPYWHKK